jgi:hypothetical protein
MMIDKINRISGIKFREVTPVFSLTSFPIHPDRDIFNLINLFDSLSWNEYRNDPFYDIELINREDTEQAPKVFIQGGSFQGPLQYLFKNSNAVDRYSYVENKIVSDCDGARIINEIEEIDIGGNLDNDIFIFEVNQRAASTMSFGFIQHMRNYIEKNGISGNFPARSEK